MCGCGCVCVCVCVHARMFMCRCFTCDFHVTHVILIPLLPHIQPTMSHYFIRLLADKGLLLRNFTQVSQWDTK